MQTDNAIIYWKDELITRFQLFLNGNSCWKNETELFESIISDGFKPKYLSEYHDESNSKRCNLSFNPESKNKINKLMANLYNYYFK